MKKVKTVRVNGTDYTKVAVECMIQPGIGIHLVGLPDISVKESLLRTVTAMQSNGFHIPGKKIIINLTPADLSKSGCGCDLPIALGMIAESGQAELQHLAEFVIIGELGLDGQIRKVPGAVQAVQAAVDNGLGVIIPRANKWEVDGLFEGVKICPVENLRDAIRVLQTGEPVEYDERFDKEQADPYRIHWNDINGQEGAKRALEIAAAGGHHVLMLGPVGTGKSQLAQAMLDILPPMNLEETREVAKVYSVAGMNRKKGRPFRAPNYSASMRTWLGGGAGDYITPGEVSLANNGVLYVCDFPEMPKSIAECLRGPLEDKKVTISRLKGKIEYPAKFQMVIGSNPCPCGYYGDGDRCICTNRQRAAYLGKLYAPVTDYVDVQVWVHPDKEGAAPGEPSSVVAERVAAARKVQMERQGMLNSELRYAELEKVCNLDEECKELFEKLFDRMGLSARAYTRALRVARTIADIDGSQDIKVQHIAEAVSYRFMDRRDFWYE